MGSGPYAYQIASKHRVHRSVPQDHSTGSRSGERDDVAAVGTASGLGETEPDSLSGVAYFRRHSRRIAASEGRVRPAWRLALTGRVRWHDVARTAGRRPAGQPSHCTNSRWTSFGASRSFLSYHEGEAFPASLT
jgi:hypothetical protein